jgi:hypothetical protein
MGLVFLFLLFISVQADVVVLPSNITDLSPTHSSGFRIQGPNLTGQRVAPLTEALSGATSAHLQVGPMGSRAIFAMLTSPSPSISLALPRKSNQAIPSR